MLKPDLNRLKENRVSKPFLCEYPPTSYSQVGLKEVEDILRDVDLNGDGLVDFEGKSLYL